MPSNWIKRTFESTLTEKNSHLRLFPVWLILGPRQVGKSSLLKHCGSERRYVDLDDLDVRRRANQDPEFFMSDLTPPLIIDEIQYAPALLSPIKRLADRFPERPGAVWLTGSQHFQVMRGVKETLAGRVAILNLLGLSDQEKRSVTTEGAASYFENLLETGFPRLFGEKDPAARDLYLSSYVQTYIERDVREILRIEKRREFEILVKMCALRTAQVVNYDDLARDVGVSPVTLKEWMSVLEDSFILRLVQPYFTNRTKRMIKSPKLYFLDAGLAAYLSGWRSAESARLGPMGGALFETHVFGQLVRHFEHRALDAEVTFWRTRDGQEIDFVVDVRGKVHPIEVKMGTPVVSELVSLAKLREPRWEDGRILSLAAPQKPEPFAPGWMISNPLSLPWDA